jgi:hypothetical protein
MYFKTSSVVKYSKRTKVSDLHAVWGLGHQSLRADQSMYPGQLTNQSRVNIFF